MKTMIFFSIINHYHDNIIINNTSLHVLAKKYTIVIKSNTPATEQLKKFTVEHSIILLDCNYFLGFGENNNFVFDYLIKSELISDDDFFLVINPDVTILPGEMVKLDSELHVHSSDIYTINLFYDKQYLKPELHIRRFPKITGPLKGLLNKDYRSDAYDKKSIKKPITVEWAAGSFLLFKKTAYEKLGGFDTKYFMYYEDVDICRRAHKKKMLLTYLPHIKAIHTGAFRNRKIFSRHFRWYIKSYLTYHLKN